MGDVAADAENCPCAAGLLAAATTPAPARRASSSGSGVCGFDCAAPSWDFVGWHLMFAAAAWLLVAFGGGAVLGMKATRDLERMKEKVVVCRGQINAVLVYVTAALSLAQCGFFVMRTITMTVSEVGFLVDLAACAVYAFDGLLIFLIAHLGGVTEGARYLASRAVIDCLVIASTACLPLVEVKGKKGWLSMSFLAAVNFRQAFRELLDVRQMSRLVPRYQVMYITVSVMTTAFAAAMSIMTLENLGDPQVLRALNEGKWNVVSSLYFIVSTISTVGYGDMVPVTTIGRLVVVIGIFGGVLMLASTLQAVVQVLAHNRQGGGVFVPPIRSQHIVVAGNPMFSTVIDFILEVFHPDHTEEAADLRVVFLLPRSTANTVIAPVAAWLKRNSNMRIAPRITLLSGNALDPTDLARSSVERAAVMILMPNYNSIDPIQEDTENIIRMMSVRMIARSLRIVLVLLKAEHLKLLRDTDIREGLLLSYIAADKFKMEIAGKTCQVPGFATVICNLCKSMGVDTEDDAQRKLPTWMQEYDRGSGNELYEVTLSVAYTNRRALFSEVAMDIIEQSEGAVYLIGLVEVRQDGFKRIMVNPGAKYRIKHTDTGTQVLGIFVAQDPESIIQCEAGGVFLGRGQRPMEAQTLDFSEVGFQSQSGQIHIDESLLAGDGMTKAQKERARELVQLASQHRKACMPARPPLKLLARGDHIVVLCLGAHEGHDLRLGIEHFIKPLRGYYAKTIKPVVVMAPVVPADWQHAVNFKKVFFIKGSPLSVFDLERVNVRGASVVFVCHAATSREPTDEAWMADSEVICATRLVESMLTVDTTTMVITELLYDGNHQFIQLPSLSDVQKWDDTLSEQDPEEEEEQEVGTMSVGLSKFVSRMTVSAPLPRTSSRKSSKFMSSRSLSQRSVQDSEAAAEASMRRAVAALRERQDYYQQPRYACGQLFIGSMLTSLVVNTYFNPSLSELVSTMIDSKIAMVAVPRDWVGKTFLEFFDHLLWTQNHLAVAILRQGDLYHRGSVGASDDDEKNSEISGVGGRFSSMSAPPAGFGSDDTDQESIKNMKVNYVYTAPPGKLTTMIESDRVICFGIAYAAMEELRREQEEQEARAALKQAQYEAEKALAVQGGDTSDRWNSERKRGQGSQTDSAAS